MIGTEADPEGGTTATRREKSPAAALPSHPPRVLPTVFSRRSLSRCIPTALLVGTVLSLINQGSIIFAGDASYVTWLRVGSNFMMPFLVSSAGFFFSQRSVWRSRTLADT